MIRPSVIGLIMLIALATGCSLNPFNKPATPTAVTVATSTPAAAAPQLQAEAKDTVVVLTWAPAGGASGYWIYRDGNPNPLNVQPINGTTYQDTGLTNGRTYTYTVAALGADGKAGPPSAPVEIAPKSK